MATTRRVSRGRTTTVDCTADPLTRASELRELQPEALADVAGGDDFGSFDWGFDSWSSGWDSFATDPFATDPFATDPFATDPFATDPFATDPFATDPFATDPFATDPFATGPFATDPFATGPFATDPFATDPFATNPVATDPFAMGPFLTDPAATGTTNPIDGDPVVTDPVVTDPGASVTSDPSAMGPFVTDPAATGTTDPINGDPVVTDPGVTDTSEPGAMGPFLTDPAAAGTTAPVVTDPVVTDPGATGTDPVGDTTPQGTWYDAGDGGSYFVPEAETAGAPELPEHGAVPPLEAAAEEHPGEMGPFPSADSPHEELPVAQFDMGPGTTPMAEGPELGGDDGFVSPGYDASGGSTYTWGPEDQAGTSPVDDHQPPATTDTSGSTSEPPVVAATPDVPLPAPIDAGPTPAADATGTPTPPAPNGGPTDASLLQNAEPAQPAQPPLPLTPAEQYEVDVYKTQNPADLLEQRGLGDCYVVSVLRDLGDTPEGRAYMDSMVKDLGDGFYQVTLVGPDGQAQVQTVWIHEGEKFGDGDPKTMALEKALVYNQQSASGLEGMNGGRVDDAMGQLGLVNVTYGPPSDALSVGIQNQVVTVQTGDVGPLPYGLVSNHAYTVVGTAIDPSSGALMVLLSNPWGDGHPLPIPADLLGTAVTGATTGQVPWPDP